MAVKQEPIFWLRVALCLGVLAQFSWMFGRPDLPRGPLYGFGAGVFGVLLVLILAAPYLFVLATSFWSRPGAIAACAGSAIGLAITQVTLSVGLLRKMWTPKLIVAAIAFGILLAALPVARPLENKRRVVLWALLTPLLLVVWYVALLVFFATTMLKPWH
jgi:hypothetical protein